jgi:hypothetical protein
VASEWLADRAAVLRGCSGRVSHRQRPTIQNISGLPQGCGRPLTGTLSFATGDPLAAVRPKEREHDETSLARSASRGSAGHRLPQNISIGPKWLDSSSAELSGDRCCVAKRRLTASFGSHRYGHGLDCTPERSLPT